MASLTLSDSELEHLVDLLEERLVERLTLRAESEDRWMTTAEAADYLGITIHALHKLTAARDVPFEQSGPGCKLWFRRRELDQWRKSGEPSSRRVLTDCRDRGISRTSNSCSGRRGSKRKTAGGGF